MFKIEDEPCREPGARYRTRLNQQVAIALWRGLATHAGAENPYTGYVVAPGNLGNRVAMRLKDVVLTYTNQILFNLAPPATQGTEAPRGDCNDRHPDPDRWRHRQYHTRFRCQGRAWEIELWLVRMLSGRASYSFTNDIPVHRLVYLSGPAGIEPHAPYLVGRDAQRAGVTDVAVIGSAELRVHSSAYLLLHLYAIVASLPAGVTSAQVAFAGGLPVEDDSDPQVRETLRQRLTSKAEMSRPPIPHVLRWGKTTYTITISRSSFIPQPIGTEGGMRLGVQNAAEMALIQHRFSGLCHLDAAKVPVLREG